MCRQCNCSLGGQLGGRGGWGEGGHSLGGLNRESGQGFLVGDGLEELDELEGQEELEELEDPEELEEHDVGSGWFGTRVNLDFLFGGSNEEEGALITASPPTPAAPKRPAAPSAWKSAAQCCPSPLEPCGVMHSCCITLCSALSLGTRCSAVQGSAVQGRAGQCRAGQGSGVLCKTVQWRSSSLKCR